MGGRGMGSKLKSASVEAWRAKDPKFQKKTSGGVYFYSFSSSVFGKDIDESMYNKLPKRMQDAVVALENSKTPDGNHATIYFVTSDRTISYFDEYGLGDFYAGVRAHTAQELGKVSDWEYLSSYKVGDQLRRRKR